MRPIDQDYYATLQHQRRKLLDLLRTTKFSRLVPHVAHQQVIPTASYSPWNDDQEFLRIYEAARSHTMVDVYRCYELWSLTQRTSAISGDIVEIGVWRGGTAAILAAANSKVQPTQSIHLFDTFTGVVNAVPGKDTLYEGGEHADTSRGVVEELMARNELGTFFINMGIFPDETIESLPNKIRLCHVDVDTYGSAKACLETVWPRLSVGGMIIFDDYGFWGCEGVTDLLNLESPNNSILIHNINGHGILIKVQLGVT